MYITTSKGFLNHGKKTLFGKRTIINTLAISKLIYPKVGTVVLKVLPLFPVVGCFWGSKISEMG